MSVLRLDALTDAALRRAAADSTVREVKAAGLPVRLRFGKDRAGSWFVVRHARGKARWCKVGAWPALPAKALLASLPDVLAKLAADDAAAVAQLAGPQTLSALLHWYAERQQQNRALSAARKRGLHTSVQRHLLPLLEAAGDLRLAGLLPADFDAAVLQPLQQRYAPATVRLDFAVVRAACRRAAALGLIPVDPMAGWTLAQFAAAKPQPKAGRLRADHLPQLLAAIAKQPAPVQLLLGLLLLCGTRLGETRRAKWAEFDLTGPAPAWNIPAAHTKTAVPLRVPLPVCAAQWLAHHQLAARSSFVLPAPRGKGQAISHQLASEWVQAASGGRWSAHDLRKLCATCWVDAGVDYFVVQMLKNHALRALDATYIHTHAEAKKREALESWAAQLWPLWPAAPAAARGACKA